MRRTLFALSLLAGAAWADSAQAQLADKLRGYSLDIEVNARHVFDGNAGGMGETINTRTIKVYVSEKGRLFDFSGASGTSARTGRTLVGAGGADVVDWGQVWSHGPIGQRWTTSGTTLVRERIYPWGRQYINIKISGDFRSCTASTQLKSTREDKKFFFFGIPNGKLIPVVDYRLTSQRCTIMHGNIFASTSI